METDLVGLGRAEATALLGADVDDGRTGQHERPTQCLEQRVDVMTRHDADVGEAEILEQLPRLCEVDDRCAHPPAPLKDGRADDRDPLDHPVVGASAVLPRR